MRNRMFVLFSIINHMGNDTCGSFPKIFNRDFEVPDLKLRNTYNGEVAAEPNEKIVRAVFPQSSSQQRGSQVASKITENKDHLFEDINFQMDPKESSRLSVLFDFKRMKTRIYTQRAETELTSFTQLQVEFCYLSAVWYFLCRREVKESLLRNIIETQETNDYGAYSLTLFCNGEPHPVIIDDKMPTAADSFVYLRIVKGFELWPLILEKAWCKQIGSYKRALGLSPEDAFQEITGIPANTYSLRSNNRLAIRGILKNALQKGYWISLIARKGLPDLRDRQVFCLQSCENEDDYLIISPYSSYSFEGLKTYQQQRRGEVRVKEQDLFTHFEYAVVGFYKQRYVPTSIPIEAKRHEQLLFEINVTRKEEVSLRFNQIYAGYLGQEERINYQYSPVLFQLYKLVFSDGARTDYELVDHCEGCNRSLGGVRSANVSDQVFEVLEGRYLLRMEVDWQHENLLNKGNLVAYSSEGNVQITQIKNNGQLSKEVYPSLFAHAPSHRTNFLPIKEHDLELHTLEKLHTILLQFRNLSNSPETFQLNLSTSKNFMVRGATTEGKLTTIKLDGQNSVILEILPNDLREGMELDGLDVTKLQRKE